MGNQAAQMGDNPAFYNAPSRKVHRERERSVYLLYFYKNTNIDANFAHPTLLRSRYSALMVHNQNYKY